MQETVKTRYSVSYHMKDLLRKDVQTVAEIAKWLEKHAVKKRDIARRTVSKRLMARLIAAQTLLKAATGDTQATESLMNRTEGKVAERVQVDEKKTVNIRIELAAGGNELEMSGHTKDTLALQGLDNKGLLGSPLEYGSSADVIEGELIVPASRGLRVPSAGSHRRGVEE